MLLHIYLVQSQTPVISICPKHTHTADNQPPNNAPDQRTTGRAKQTNYNHRPGIRNRWTTSAHNNRISSDHTQIYVCIIIHAMGIVKLHRLPPIIRVQKPLPPPSPLQPCRSPHMITRAPRLYVGVRARACVCNICLTSVAARAQHTHTSPVIFTPIIA